MAGKSLRRGMTRPLVVIGAAMVVLTPAVAYAGPLTVTVYTPGATTGPSGAFSEISTDAHCAGGSLISGGGADQAIGTGMSSNGNHLNGIEPSSDGSTEPLGGTPPVTNANAMINNATYWLGIGGTGGMTNASFSTTPYAVCFNSSVVTGTEVVVSSIANTGVVMATCPSGTVLIGGGARATPAGDGSMKPIAGYPTYSTGHSGGLVAAGDTNVNPDSWAAYGYFGSSPATYAFAICGTGTNLSGVSTKVHLVEVSGPTSATAGQTETVGCNHTGDGTLLSGGAAISAGGVDSTGFALPGSQGDHLNGSYPSDSSGNPAGNNTTATYWTAYTHTGGQTSSGTYTDVWALCGSGM